MRVRCINATHCSAIQEGRIYTVARRTSDYFFLEEVGITDGNGYFPDRFRPLKDTECPQCGQEH